MSQYGQTSKNPPWVRSGQNVGQNQGAVAQSLMANALPMANASMLQYPSVFQNQLNPQVYGAAVQYPTRALNSAAFQTNSSNLSSGHGNQGNLNPNLGGSGPNNPNKAQRVFTGTVTKLQDNFGFVNNDIFFQTSCCVKGSNPQVGDRVLVEAVYNENMPFKWNASRIQVLNNRHEQNAGGRFNASNNSYKPVPPPNENSGSGSRFSSGGGSGGGSRFSNNDRSRARSRSADRNKNRTRPAGFKPDNVEDRKRKRDDERSVDRERERDRQRSPPAKKRSKSPAKKSRQPRRPPPRYTVIVPKGPLGSPEFDLVHLTKRFPNLYVPSDFFLAQAKWLGSFPVNSPLSLNFPCNFHVFHKDVDSPYQNEAVLEPSDVDYIYVAKVMLLSSPGLEELLTKTGIVHESEMLSKDETDDESTSSAGGVTHISRLIHFLVGTRGKEPMAIGGPWSPSLDGPNPESDPGVLVKTAIRSCKALTGIDLSACTQWFRFLEVHYHRAEVNHHGKLVPARVETVVIFVPDVWSATPSRVDWEKTTADYKAALDSRLNPKQSTPEPPSAAAPSSGATAPDKNTVDEKDADTSKDDENLDNSSEKSDLPKKDPTHYSQLDPKSMKVSELRDELEARNLSPKGLKSQLVARLAKAIKTEADEEEANGNVKDDPNAALDETVDEKESKDKNDRPVSPSPSNTSRKGDEKRKDDENDKEKDKKKEELTEKEKMHLEKRYRLPETPQILVHPNRAHKGGKFDCAVLSVSSLLGYRVEDSKEHAFEVSLFAEAFNEMLMRDYGFTIYKAILDAPEKPKEEKKEKDEKDKDKKKEKDGKENEKNKEEEKVAENSKDKKDDDSVIVEEEENRKKDDAKPRLVDMNILLAFSYFDTTRCGYIYDKDLGDLLYCLGLTLSRSQVKKLIQKVTSRDSVHYKKLAEKHDDGDEKMETNDTSDDYIQGNRKYLVPRKPEGSSPSKKKKSVDANLQSGFVMHNGSLIDINKLLGQLSKSENSKLETERDLNRLRSDYSKLKETQGKSDRIIKDLQSDIRTYKDKMANSFVDLTSAQSNERAYFKAIVDVYNRLSPIIKKKEDEEETRKKKLAEAEVMEIVELTDDDKKEEVKVESSAETTKKIEPKEEK